LLSKNFLYFPYFKLLFKGEVLKSFAPQKILS